MTEAISPHPDTFETYKAQFGEDRLLDDFFGHKRDGFYVEVGAYNGVDMSNSFHFEQIGWQGLLVEADPDLAGQCRQARPGAIVEHCAVVPPRSSATVTFQLTPDAPDHSSLSLDQTHLKKIEWLTGNSNIRQTTVPAKTLDLILETHGVKKIDFVTIDVEGHEWGVLRGFAISRWKPKIVIIERNTVLPDRRIISYMHRRGYLYRRTTGVNDWFERAAPGAGGRRAYRLWLLRTYYLPKYRSIARTAAGGALGPILKPVLRRLGLRRD